MRHLICLTLALALLTSTGHAEEEKKRWIQDYGVRTTTSGVYMAFMVFAEKPLENSCQRRLPSLAVGCTDRNLRLIVDLGLELPPGDIDLNYRFDDQGPKGDRWQVSRIGSRLKAPEPLELAKQIAQHSSIEFELEPEHNLGDEMTVSFNLPDFTDELAIILELCRSGPLIVSRSLDSEVLPTAAPHEGGETALHGPALIRRIAEKPESTTLEPPPACRLPSHGLVGYGGLASYERVF